MKKSTKIAIICIAVALLVIGIVAILIYVNNKVEAKEELVTASSVKFLKSGQYTTTVNSEKIDLSGISKDNVEISYNILSIKAEEGSNSNSKNFETVKLKVENIVKNANGGYDISFTDDKAKEYRTVSYIINFKDINEFTTVSVDYPEIKLTPDIDFVTTGATTTKVTLSIDGSEFEEGITKDNIKLDNSFSDMKIESISNSEKNLTMQLSGSPVKSVANSYDFGSIQVNSSAIKNGYTDTFTKIDIKYDNAYFDESSLKYTDGKIYANLLIYGVADINNLSKDNIIVEGATVESVEKKDNNTLALTLTADGINSVNSFVDIVSEKTLKLGDFETEIQLAQAKFYPVFDYVEKIGDNLKLTIKLYAYHGTFDNSLNANNIKFAGDFEGAKIESVKKDSDSVSTLIFTIPANNQTVDTMKVDGTITLEQGSLVNKYGEKTSKECSYTRDYSSESLGKEISLDVDTLLEIQKYTRGQNTVFGNICYWGGVAGKTYSIGKSLLEAIGVVESEHAQVMRTLNEINNKLDKTLDGIKEIRHDILELTNEVNQTKLINYNTDLIIIRKKIDNLKDVYRQAAKELANENPEYANIDWDNLTEESALEYNHKLYNHIMAKVNAKDVNYLDYESDAKELKDAFERVTGVLEVKDQFNPIIIYDQICSKKYNFDSQAYEYRLAQRTAVETLLTKAKAVLAFRYDAATNPDGAAFKGINRSYTNAINALDELGNIGHPAKDIKTGPDETDPEYFPYCYVLGKKVNYKYSDNVGDDPLTIMGAAPFPDNDEFNKSCPNHVKFYSHLFGGLRIRVIDGVEVYQGRDWTEDEINDFTARLNGKSLNENLKSAGIEIKYPLLLSLKFEEKNRTQSYTRFIQVWKCTQYNGDIINIYNNQISKDVKLRTIFAGDEKDLPDWLSEFNESFQEVTRFDLW